MAVAIAGALGCMVATEYAWFLLFRVVQAVGCGCFVLSQALVQDLFVGRQQERLRIALVTASGIFISLSPLLGTWLQAHLGWQGSFGVFVGLGLLVILKACVLLENTARHGDTPEEHSRGLPTGVCRPDVRRLLADFGAGLRLP